MAQQDMRGYFSKALDMAVGHRLLDYLSHKSPVPDGAGFVQPDDVVAETIALRSAKGWTWGYALIRRLPDGRCAMCDRSDRVYVMNRQLAGFDNESCLLDEYMERAGKEEL